MSQTMPCSEDVGHSTYDLTSSAVYPEILTRPENAFLLYTVTSAWAFQQMRTEFTALFESIAAEMRRISGAVDDLKRKQGESQIAETKAIILRRLQSAEDEVFPGEIAVEFNLDYGIVIKAIEEMRRDGILE